MVYNSFPIKGMEYYNYRIEHTSLSINNRFVATPLMEYKENRAS